MNKKEIIEKINEMKLAHGNLRYSRYVKNDKEIWEHIIEDTAGIETDNASLRIYCYINNIITLNCGNGSIFKYKNAKLTCCKKTSDCLCQKEVLGGNSSITSQKDRPKHIDKFEDFFIEPEVSNKFVDELKNIFVSEYETNFNNFIYKIRTTKLYPELLDKTKNIDGNIFTRIFYIFYPSKFNDYKNIILTNFIK